MKRALVLAMAIGLLGAHSAQAQQVLETEAYTAQFPADWAITVKPDRGIVFHTIVTPGATVADHWVPIPSAGGIALHVSHEAAAIVRKRFRSRRAPRAGGQMAKIIGTPRIAKRFRFTSNYHPARVDGARGVAVAFRYRYRGVENVQRDIAVRHGRYLVLIEMNCRPDLEPAGRAAMRQLVKSLRWK
jgi:hypothetical protein